MGDTDIGCGSDGLVTVRVQLRNFVRVGDEAALMSWSLFLNKRGGGGGGLVNKRGGGGGRIGEQARW